MWLPNCVVTSKAHCACLEAEVPELNPVKWYVQNVFYIYVILGMTRQAIYVLYCIYYAFIKSIQGLIPIGYRTCRRIIQRYLG
jgi:hypothetical protein